MMLMKKEVEGHIIRLAQKSRAAGIHLILATQKPTVDVITGLIKSNLPARICFQVASRSDSRVVLDEMGADKLLGKGDMLFLQPGTSTIIRAQGTYVGDEEIERVVNAIATDTPSYDSELLKLKTREQTEAGRGGDIGEKLRDRDPLYEQAVEIVVREQRGSVSLLAARPRHRLRPGRRASSTSWPRTASSAPTTAATPARCWSRSRSGKRRRRRRREV